ncbi:MULTISPECIES: hypothetical protein [Nostocales]|uniref:Uncharacterized protein n=3 Tax=Nostocales TaxID=1161 RepID=A0A8S9SYX5_9CYAN|nr:hypothetical protein [Tolypothrix bouteillei]KAF3884957.1 hypothetical protein DA73_0400005395 [Tolypothrix bouteillei VB521301]
MNRYKSLKLGLKLGLEFWLPLVLLGFVLWVGGGCVMDGILSQPDHGESHLKVEMQPIKPRQTLRLFIKAEIDKQRGISRVEVKTAYKAVKGLTFVFPVTEASQVEAAIAKELGLLPEDIRSVMYYQKKLKDRY